MKKQNNNLLAKLAKLELLIHKQCILYKKEETCLKQVEKGLLALPGMTASLKIDWKEKTKLLKRFNKIVIRILERLLFLKRTRKEKGKRANLTQGMLNCLYLKKEGLQNEISFFILKHSDQNKERV